MTRSKSSRTPWPEFPLTDLYDISSGLSKPRSASCRRSFPDIRRLAANRGLQASELAIQNHASAQQEVKIGSLTTPLARS